VTSSEVLALAGDSCGLDIKFVSRKLGSYRRPMRKTFQWNVILSAVVLSGLFACKTDETLSVKEALKLTADVQTKKFTPSPRSMVDITAILDETEAVDLS
jgi:hypothetical protein